ncbi:MAG: UvrD-helicase domain-containing protein [Anaerolineae bacterium]|nr:UvrD-helicase domain-containing protein [Anaerolineae bacterium]
MPESPLLEGLNPQQRDAVSAGTGPHLILAGPGSGKTRVLTHRVAYLVQEMGVTPYRIMAVTFTNKAAREMQQRVERMLGGQELSGLSLGTFHALCARILRVEAENTPYTRDYVIFDTRDQLTAVKQAATQLNIDIKRFTPRSLLDGISAAKNELLTPEVFADRVDSYFAEIVSRVYFAYQEILLGSNAMDFDDLLMQTVLLFQQYADVAAKYQRRYEHVLVDEFQDTNYAQYKLIHALAAPQNNLFAVGDPDQSIYAFRGADYRNVQRFQKDFPDARVILLEQNYRSTQTILDAATAVINVNTNRTPKRLFTARGKGERIALYEAYDEDDEARHILNTILRLNEEGRYNPGECAIMYRTNAQSRPLEEAFRRAGVPYRLIGATRFYDRREIRDLLAYLRLIHNPDDGVSLERIINVPTRGIGERTLGELRAWAESVGLSPGRALLALLEGADAPFSPRSRRALEAFAGLLAHWQALAAAGRPPLPILDAVIDDTGLAAYLRDGSHEGEDRWENVLSLRESAADYEHADLAEFLTQVALVSDVDVRDDNVDAPALLTLHSAKGLEFPVVFLCGLEEGTLPHLRSLEADAEGDPDALAEERRLMYVGITRAKDRLYLSYAFRRTRFGDSEPSLPSRFLQDVPPALLEGAPLAGTSRAAQDSFARMTAWMDDLPRPHAARNAPPPPRFQPGMRVINPHFGEGVVIAARRYHDAEEVDVQFDRAGRKRIDGNFLEPLG